MMMEDKGDMALPAARAATASQPSPSVSAVPASVPNAAPSLHDEMVSAIYQYHSDLRRPPSSDSVQRRLAWIEKIITKIQQEDLQ